MKRLQSIGVMIFALCFAPRFTMADDSPKYAERGMSAYYSGKFDLARLFFSKALQDAILKGKEEWIVKATLNLVDLELEALEEAEAGRLLEGLTTKEKNLRSLILWKRSQLAYQQRHFPEALASLDSALVLAKGDKAKELAMRLDHVRFRIQSTSPSIWGPEYDSIKNNSGRIDRGRIVGLEAMAAMSRREFGKADTLWMEAMNVYRDQGRLAKVAACLNQRALCLFSSGYKDEALEINMRSVAIYSELGLELPGLRAQALRLLLVEDPKELAKLHQDMDLVGQKFSGFDLQGVLDEYSHSMHFGRVGVGP